MLRLRTGITTVGLLSPSEYGVNPAAGGAIPLWWDPNGEGLPVVGAYRAIATVGSPWPLAPAAYADTLVNWSNPGVNDLVQVSGLPAPVPWALNTGWQFVVANTDTFDTGLAPGNTWTMLVQFTGQNAVNRYLAGIYDNVAPSLFAVGAQVGIRVIYWNEGNRQVAPNMVFGNLCVAGNQGYRNGMADGAAIPAGPALPPISIYIGALNQFGLSVLHTTANILAAAAYNATLTAPQILAVATAMGAL